MPKMAAKPDTLLSSLQRESLDGCLTVLNSFLGPNQPILGSVWHWRLNILPSHAKVVVIYAPKMPKMATKPESLLPSLSLEPLDGCLSVFNSFSDPNQLFCLWKIVTIYTCLKYVLMSKMAAKPENWFFL